MSPQAETFNRRVLVIDDNQAIVEDFRKILGAGLGGNGALARAEAALFGDDDGGSDPAALHPEFEIDSANQGQEGFALVEQARQDNRPYAMAFIDMRMPPGWDGVETIARIWDKDPHLQVVVCTAYSDYSWEEMSARLDPGDRLLILKKPFDNVEAYQLATALTMKWQMTQQAQLKMNALEEAVRARTQALSGANQALQAEIVERKQLEARLEQLSVTDPLTGLANRRRFADTFEAEWNRALRSRKPLSLAMIDVDHFKRYNDHYGHIGGDACLQLVATELRLATRNPSDLVARYGGEEFAIILPESDLAATCEVAQRCCSTIAGLKQPHAASDSGIVTISAGVATLTPSPQTAPQRLIELADAALYEAKRGGRNRVASKTERCGIEAAA